MDIKAEAVPLGIEWSTLSEQQKQVLDQAMLRFVPLVHSRENTIRHWLANRRLVAFYQGQAGRNSPWRLVYHVDGTKVYRVVCDVDPVAKTVSWHVGRIQFHPVKVPQVVALG